MYLTGEQSAYQCVFCASAAPCTLFPVNCCSPACSWGCTTTCFVKPHRTCGEVSLMADLRVDVCITSTKCSLWKPLQIEPAFVSHRQYRQAKEVVFHCELLRTGSSSEQAVPWNWQYLRTGCCSSPSLLLIEKSFLTAVYITIAIKKFPVMFFPKQGHFICFLWVLFISRCLDKFFQTQVGGQSWLWSFLPLGLSIVPYPFSRMGFRRWPSATGELYPFISAPARNGV